MKTWKIAIVGCGEIAEYTYLPNLDRNQRVEVVACCDLKPERVRLFMEKFGIPRGYPNIDELLAQCEFDIMMDLASIPAHYELNKKALEAGKHLYSQKPVALNEEQAADLIETARRNGVKFSASPIHMLRPDIRQARQLLADGAIGRLLFIRSMVAHGGPEYFQYRANDPSWFYEPGAGALYDLGVHALHMVTGIAGPAKTVFSRAATAQPVRTVRSGAFDGKEIQAGKLFDNYLISLDFGNGVLGDIVTGFCVKGNAAPELEIYGELGSIVFPGGGAPLKVYLDDPEKKIRGWMKPEPQTRPAEEFFQASCIGDLVRAIEQEEPVGLPPEQARHVIEIMCRVEESARDGETKELKTAF